MYSFSIIKHIYKLPYVLSSQNWIYLRKRAVVEYRFPKKLAQLYLRFFLKIILHATDPWNFEEKDAAGLQATSCQKILKM